MACCDWDTFKDAFLGAWNRAKYTPSEVLIDWRRAKRDWKRYHCTGYEAATMQLQGLAKDSEYLWVARANRRRGGDGGMAVERVPEAV